PTGDKDPFALRRHALGVIRMLIERRLPLNLGELLESAALVFPGRMPTQTPFNGSTVALQAFVLERLAGSLREQGYSAQEVDAV
ncbi:UNVERIFIED_CONTAM: glycine--tRNA ligase subunit beta, partial [Salmonella enterica subsp. enterica serovar Weltevreden]